MDLIQTLMSTLQLRAPDAEAIAGGVLASVDTLLRQRSGNSAAERFRQAIPELAIWKGSAARRFGGGGEDAGAEAGGDLSRQLGGFAGPADQGALATMLSQVGLDQSKAVALLPIAIAFLRDRLPAEVMADVDRAVPWLSGVASQEGPVGAIAGALGGASPKRRP